MRRAIHAVFVCALLILCVALAVAAQSQQTAPSPKPDEIPVTDGTSGPCSIEFSVYTNAQGKAKFTGIPAKVKRSPIEFNAKKDDLVGLATMDPETECQAKHDIVMDKKSSH
jgi:hypothetical protein